MTNAIETDGRTGRAARVRRRKPGKRNGCRELRNMLFPYSSAEAEKSTESFYRSPRAARNRRLETLRTDRTTISGKLFSVIFFQLTKKI